MQREMSWDTTAEMSSLFCKVEKYSYMIIIYKHLSWFILSDINRKLNERKIPTALIRELISEKQYDVSDL